MKPEETLPQKIITLYDASLLDHLPASESATPYAVIPAQGLGRIMGFPWWQALTQPLGIPAIFDADDAPALAASALRSGAQWVVYTQTGPTLETLLALARICNGHVLTSRPDALTLGRPPYNAYRIGQLSQYLARES